MLDDVFRPLWGLWDLNMYPAVKSITHKLGGYGLSFRAERKKFDGSGSIDNRGSPVLGPTQGGVSLRALDLLCQHEAYQFKRVTAPTTKLRKIETSSDWILSPSGLRFPASVSRTPRPNPVAASSRCARADYQGFASCLELAKPVIRHVASQGEDRRDVRLFAGAAYRF